MPVKSSVNPTIISAIDATENFSPENLITETEQVASFTIAFQLADSQNATQTQPLAPTQYCVGFTTPVIDSLKVVSLHFEHTASFGSQYVVLLEGK